LLSRKLINFENRPLQTARGRRLAVPDPWLIGAE